MPYPQAHRLLTIYGDAWTQQEEWAMTCRLSTGGSTAPVDEASLELLWDAAAAFMGTAGICQHARLLGVKLAPQDTQGRYPAGADAQDYVGPAPVPGNIDGGIPQASLVISLTTALSRGRGSRGRMYGPAYGPSAGADGRISLARAETYRDAALLLMAGINGADVGTVAVGSMLAGSLREVTGLRIGRVVDTQRRRRNQLTEEYLVAPLA